MTENDTKYEMASFDVNMAQEVLRLFSERLALS